MAKYQRFEDLPVWQEARRLYNAVLNLFEGADVPLSGAFRNKLERAALSVSNNIAEGFERDHGGVAIVHRHRARFHGRGTFDDRGRARAAAAANGVGTVGGDSCVCGVVFTAAHGLGGVE